MAAFAVQVAARLSVICFEARQMRFTVVATGQFSSESCFRVRPRGFFPDSAFGREQFNSTGGTHTRVAFSFTGAHPKSEVRNPSSERNPKGGTWFKTNAFGLRISDFFRISALGFRIWLGRDHRVFENASRDFF